MRKRQRQDYVDTAINTGPLSRSSFEIPVTRREISLQSFRLLFSCSRAWFLLLLFLLIGAASPAAALNLNGYWSYRQSGAEARDTLTEFQQRYSLGVGQALTYRPTHAISASAAVGYTRTESNSGAGFLTTDNITPTGQVSLQNDIFLVQLSGNTAIRIGESNESSQSSWQTTIASVWDIPLWPTLRFSYSEFIEPVPGVELFAISGQKEKTTNVSLGWDLILATLAYTFTNNISENPVGDSLSESNSHFARVETDGRFWDKRISYNFAQQFNYSTQDISLQGADGFFDLEVPGTPIAKLYESPENPLDPEDPLNPNYDEPGNEDDPGDSDDKNLLTSSIEVSAEQRVHIRFETSFEAREIDVLRLQILDNIELQQAVNMEWEIYYKVESGEVNWQGPVDPFSNEISDFVDDSIEIEVNLPDPVAEILLVETTGSKNFTLTINKLEAFTTITQDFSSKTTGRLTNFGLAYRIRPNLRVSGNMTLVNNEVENEDDVLETSRWSANGNIRWTPSPSISPALGFSEYHEDSSLGPENISRSYSLTVATIPLESVNMTFGARHSERYTGSEKNFVSDRYTLSTNARIYPDLTGTWSLSYGDTESLQNDGTASRNRTITNSLRFNARLNPRLNLSALALSRKLLVYPPRTDRSSEGL